jgi:hypothetical protein
MDHVERVLIFSLIPSKLSFLNVDEQRKLIESFCYKSERCVADFFNFSINISLCILESCDQFVTVFTFLFASHYKEFDRGTSPIVLKNTGTNVSIKSGKVLSKEVTLIILNKILNVVELTDNCHYIFS